MTAKLADITPPHDPVSIARDMLEKAPGCRAGLYVLIDADDRMHWEMCGHQRKDILWALQKMIHSLMLDEDPY